MDSLVYKITDRSAWDAATAVGYFAGAPIDLADGYIHFSTAAQVRETASKHFAGKADLVLVGVDARALGQDLRWEPSRGGALFPHLYARLDVRHVHSVVPLPMGADGRHVFPEDFA